jgi:hypothetical protein
VLVDRQQAQGRDAELLQVCDRGGMREAGKAATQLRRDRHVVHREALDVHLVDHGVGERHARRGVAAPVEAGVADDARFQRVRGVVARIGAIRMGGVGAAVFVEPRELALDLARVRVELQLRGVESMADVRLPRPARAQAVELPRPQPADVPVVDVAAARWQHDARGLVGAGSVEQAQLDARRVRREHRDVRAVGVDVDTERPGQARADGHGPSHSKITVASGGRSITIDWGRPCAGVAMLVARPSGVPTLLPP